MQLPFFKTIEALFFNDYNIFIFFKQYNKLCTDFYLNEKDKRVQIFYYIDLIFKDQVRVIKEYCLNDLKNYKKEEFYCVFKKKYKVLN